MWYFKLFFLVLCLFFTSLVWAMGEAPSDVPKSYLIGKAAPDAVLTNTEGKTASVIGSSHGEKTVLIFWATWCPHCYEELGSLNDNIASIEQKGIKIDLLDVGETQEAVKNYFNRRQMKLVSFVDEDSYLQGMYHLVGIPTLIFVDEKGIIRSVTHQFPSDYENYFSSK